MKMCVCASPEYLAEHGEPQHPNDLVEHNCIIDQNFRGGKHWPFLENGKEFTVDVTGNFLANSPSAIRRQTIQGQGIGLCPLYVISEDLISGRIVRLFESMESINFGVYAMYPHRKHLSTRVRKLVDHLQFEFRKA